MKTRVKVWVREIPVQDQIFWFVAMTIGITLSLSLGIALWQFGAIGGFLLGVVFCHLLRS